MPSIHAPPDALMHADPVRQALDDPLVREKIAVAARIALRRWMKYAKPQSLEQAAEEVASEAQATAWGKSSSYDPKLGSPCSWICGFVYRVAMKRNDRILRRKTTGLPIDLADPSPSAENCLIAAADRESLRGAFAALDTVDRRIADLHFVEGKPHAEVAAALGITPVNARVRTCRIRKELSAILSPFNKGGQS